MAKHKHKNRDSMQNNNEMNNNNNMQNTNSNPFGIDPFALMNLLGGNMDMRNLGNVLSSINTNGFNIGNLENIAKMAGINLNAMNNNMNGISSMMNTHSSTNNEPNNVVKPTDSAQELNDDIEDIDIESKPKKSEKKKNEKKQGNIITKEDENLIFLKQLRSYIHPNKAAFIDKIIKLYMEGKINI